MPAGTTAVMNIFLLHRDETVFPNPDKFDPDRFLPENKLDDPYSYMPFSAGSRNCIGKLTLYGNNFYCKITSSG